MITQTAVVGRRACALLTACSAVLHGTTIVHTETSAAAVLMAGMGVACLYCARDLWLRSALRTWVLVANPRRPCDAARVSARTAKPPVPRRIPVLAGRMSVHRAMAPSAFRPRRFPRKISPAMNPQKKPSRRNPRACRLFLRATADAMKPHIAETMATARNRKIRCVGPSDPISQPPGPRLRRPLARSNHRFRRNSVAGRCS